MWVYSSHLLPGIDDVKFVFGWYNLRVILNFYCMIPTWRSQHIKSRVLLVFSCKIICKTYHSAAHNRILQLLQILFWSFTMFQPKFLKINMNAAYIHKAFPHTTNKVRIMGHDAIFDIYYVSHLQYLLFYLLPLH